MIQTPTRKPDVWGTLVSFLAGHFQKWYLLIDGRRQEESEQKARATRPFNKATTTKEKNNILQQIKDLIKKAKEEQKKKKGTNNNNKDTP